MATPADKHSDKLAVLIDADNAPASIANELFAEISRYGIASVKRAYGDWTTPNLRSWKDVLHRLAIQPMQQFSYTTGKNATDSALIIDAMDVLHTGDLDGFCLVSSDSDFTRLAQRIRESGLKVYGFGEKKTPQPFIAACDKFIYIEILRKPAAEPVPEKPASGVAPEAKPAPPVERDKLEPMLRNAVAQTAKDDGWASLSTIGSFLVKIDPAFDARNFGFSKLGELVRAQAYLEVRELPASENSTIVHLQVRLRQASRGARRPARKPPATPAPAR